MSMLSFAGQDDEDWLEDDGGDGEEPWATPQPQPAPAPEPRHPQPEAFVTPPTRAAVRTAVQVGLTMLQFTSN